MTFERTPPTYSSNKTAQKIDDYRYECARFNEEGLC